MARRTPGFAHQPHRGTRKDKIGTTVFFLFFKEQVKMRVISRETKFRYGRRKRASLTLIRFPFSSPDIYAKQ